MTNTIDSSLLLTEYQNSKRNTGSSTLGKDDFLKLLMAQLQNQDPTNPMDDTTFIAQMAQFSSLEQITNMNSTLEKFIGQQQQNQLISYNQFIGKDVNWHKLKDLGDGTTKIEEGNEKIVSIQYKNDSVHFILEDGIELLPENISQLNETSRESNMLQASMMIGKTVTFLNDSNEEISAIVQSVSFKNGKTTYLLDDPVPTSLTASQIIKIQ